MCWVSKQFPTRNIAANDIVCYKVFHTDDITWNYKKGTIEKMISFYERYSYIPYNRNHTIDLIYFNSGGYNWDSMDFWLINNGYHSYATLETAKKQADDSFHIIECIIPKGTIYYLNESNEIVSSTIIITDKIVK